MADASCGPSNAFKGLARHIEQDRSHQQDRVGPGSQHQHPAQVRLSNSYKFGAFQQQNAALPQRPEPDWKGYSHPANLPSHPPHAVTFFPQPTSQPAGFAPSAGGTWVNDFQRMSFADAHADPLHTQRPQGPMMGQPSMADPIRSSLAVRQHPASQLFQPSPMAFHPINHQFGTVPAIQTNHNMQTPEYISNTSAIDIAAEEATLQREFEAAMDEWMLQNGPGAETSDQSEINAQDEGSLKASPYVTSEPTEHDMPEKSSAENRDELARAAAQLVESLAENESEKFKNSDFLALMRRIASQELTVQGNDLVETQPSTDNPPGSHITGSTFAIPSTATDKPSSPYEKQQGPVDQIGSKQTTA
ncbi:hypothetical protein GQX73_g9103 [Xylaria multiplex]|uniref:Peroxin 20 n=1 Tax=Xylaria multiplex TaxID=323545 RepID=A0A7C8MN09_9PEZI|nr:hypothetical protein GQX73_g9103 [Xylaria multiplex]